MLTFYQLKTRFQALLRPIVKRFAQYGITPNQITIAALALSFVGGALIAINPDSTKPLLLLPLLLLVRMALNAIDGMLAREHSQQSYLGAILNEVGDVLADAALYLPLALLPKFNAILVVLLVVFAIISEMVGVLAVQIGAKRQYQGPMGKSDRAVWLGAVALLLGCGIAAGAWVNWVLALILLMLLMTIFNRAKAALIEVETKEATVTHAD